MCWIRRCSGRADLIAALSWTVPDIRGREEVLRVHSKKVPMAEDVNLNILARGTPGFSGADLANMVNEAA